MRVTVLRRACMRGEIEDLRFHDLRHEYGSRLGDADMNLKKIARLMGHSNTKQTERYVHPDNAGLVVATSVAAQNRSRKDRRGRAEMSEALLITKFGGRGIAVFNELFTSSVPAP